MLYYEGNSEECMFIGGGVALYVYVHAFEAFDKVKLLCEETNSGENSRTKTQEDEVELLQQVPLGGLGAVSGEVLRFNFAIPTGTGAVSCGIFGGSGDADLIMRFDEEPEVTTTPPGSNAVSQS